jgi:hypothetical protein
MPRISIEDVFRDVTGKFHPYMIDYDEINRKSTYIFQNENGVTMTISYNNRKKYAKLELDAAIYRHSPCYAEETVSEMRRLARSIRFLQGQGYDISKGRFAYTGGAQSFIMKVPIKRTRDLSRLLESLNCMRDD